MPDALDPPLRSLKTRLVRGGSGVFGLRVCAMVLGFFVDILLTRRLGLSEYGLFCAGISCLSLLLSVGVLGMNGAMLKVIPSEGVRGRSDLARGMIRWSSQRMTFAGLVLAAGMAASAWLLRPFLDPILVRVLLVLAIFLPLQVVAVHRQAVLLALKHPVLGQFSEQVLRWAVFALLLLVAATAGAQIDAVHAAWMYGGGIVAGLLFAHRWQAKQLRLQVPESGIQIEPSVWWWLALPLCWNAVMRMFGGRADPFLLATLHSPDSAALYAIADRLASLLQFGLIAIGAVVAPLIAECHAAGDRRELQAIATLAAKGLALYTVPLAAVLVIAGPWILRIFGQEFGDAYPALVLLVAGRSLMCMAGCVGYLLSMTGHHKMLAAVLTTTAVIKLSLNLVLIPAFGDIGAASATFGSLLITSVWLATLVRRRVGLDSTLMSAMRSAPAC